MGMPVNARVYVRDFGPFEEASIEVRPLTVLVGRNSVGKSMLLQLVWALTVAMPDLKLLGEAVSELGAGELVGEVLEGVEKGSASRDSFKRLLKLYLEALPGALATGLGRTLEEVFGAGLQELVRSGSGRAVVGVAGSFSSIEFVIEGGRLAVSRHKPYEGFLDELEVTVPAPGRLRIIHRLSGVSLYDEAVLSPSDLVDAVLKVLAIYLYKALDIFFEAPGVSVLLPDSRAGLSRILLKPYARPSLLKDVLYPDEHFRDAYFMLAESLAEGKVDTGDLEDFLRELGCSVEAIPEGGVRAVYVNTWSGQRLPLPRAPSGVRESLAVALALVVPEQPWLVFIEEPEAHLHPRAQKALARLIARAVKKHGKVVVLSTHSDYLLYAVSNMVALSSSPGVAERLGYSAAEVLDPGLVAAYLLRAEGRRAVVERLDVGPEGVPEEEFVRVAEELAEERARILA
ncbi:conserved hypothetical protein [Thermofilum pendens Hrk 5]|uniref:ATPase AAA-type core domain-containing protein n=1 Tax=Thermofilum pendens (strain DSM 2475 / Hrk 5) TaxID=368408 RepID=A1S0W8_THEPD|nr:AAA family ATPase [Thermofilum pendens]ABL79098.1 conserved hypothetical protein [Thermofilum pendens Hrk 5]